MQKKSQGDELPVPYLAIDREFTVTSMNQAGADLVEKRPEEAVGQKCYDLFKTPHCRTEKCALAQAMKKKRTVTEETIARPREGMVVPIRYTGSPQSDENGNIMGATEFVLDITE